MWDIEIDTRELEHAWAQARNALSDGIRRGVQLAVEEGAEQARSAHPYTDRTGKLTQSISGKVLVSTTGGATGVIEAKASYASYVEGGTAAHAIRGNPFLRFQVNGQWVTTTKEVQHPGTKPYPFMGPAYTKAERVLVREVEIAAADVERIMNR